MMPQLRRAALIGLAFGAGAVHLAAVGVLLAMHQRWIVIDVLSLGQAALLLIAGGAGAMAGRPLPGLLAGAAAGVPIAVLAVVMSIVPLHSIFIALSSDLFDMLTLHLGLAAGVAILIGGGASCRPARRGLACQSTGRAPRDLPGRDRGRRRRRVPGADPAHAAAIRGADRRLPRLHLHLGGPQPAGRRHDLHPCRTVQPR